MQTSTCFNAGNAFDFFDLFYLIIAIIVWKRFFAVRFQFSTNPDAIEWGGNTFGATNCINIHRILTILMSFNSPFRGVQIGQMNIDTVGGSKSIALSFDGVRASWIKVVFCESGPLGKRRSSLRAGRIHANRSDKSPSFPLPNLRNHFMTSLSTSTILFFMGIQTMNLNF